jgi:sugar (pentulose or hexulose) kinase
VKKFIPDEHNHKIYSALYKRVYKNIYKNLSGLYKEIQAITGYPIIY